MLTNCTNCNKEIDRKPSYIKKNKTISCSPTCRSELYTKRIIWRVEEDYAINLKDYLAREYTMNKKGIRYIVKKLGLNNQSVSNLLRYYNIPIRYGSEAIATQWINNNERRENQSESCKDVFLDSETRELIRGIQQLDEYKEKLRVANSGDKNGMYGRRQEQSPTWQGGKTSLSEYLRGYIGSWRTQQLQKSNYRCDVTGKSDNLVVHHLEKPFHKIRDDILGEVGITVDLNNPIENIDGDTLIKISEKIRMAHDSVEGVALRAEVHAEFHNIYGYSNTNAEQYYEFKERRSQPS